MFGLANPQTLCEKAQRRPWVVFALIAIFFAIQMKWWWTPTPDAANYLSMARHFSQGELQRLGSPHLRYAPGFPLVIAPAFWIADRPFFFISLIQFSLALCFAGGVYIWLRRYTETMAGPLTLLIMVNVSVWYVFQLTLSEIAFMTELIWAALALDRVIQSETAGQAARWSVVAAPLLILTCLTRQVGVLLVPAFGLLLAWRAVRGQTPWRQAMLRAALVGVPVIGAVAGFSAWDHAVSSQLGASNKSYIEYFDDEQMTLAQQLLEGVRLRISEFGRLMIPGMFKAYGQPGNWRHVSIPLYLSATVLLAAGWWSLARRRVDVLLLTLPVYVGFYVIWPFGQSTRYMVPMLPMLVLSLWAFMERFAQRREAIVTLLIFTHAGVAMVYWVRDLDEARLSDDWPALAEVTRSIEGDEDSIAVLGFDKPSYWMLVLESDSPYPLQSRPEEIRSDTDWVIALAETAHLSNFSEYKHVGRFKLFKRNRAGRRVENTSATRPSATSRQ